MQRVKIDPKREMHELYAPTQQPAIVEVPELHFLQIDGRGDPNTSPDFRAAIAALYSVSYAAKFAVQRSIAGVDFTVMPLEALWWADDLSQLASSEKSDWYWTAMIMQPEPVTAQIIDKALSEVTAKKDLPALELLRFESLREGTAAQVLHIGPYADEGPTTARLHAFIAEHGYAPVGKHHEIYLSDPGRCAPEKLRTVIRQPIAAP
ncbi:MAG TPA: GyrI-like domain-containing protein [Solirubrobacteraceae bacterium]|jgi:hypothetical protein